MKMIKIKDKKMKKLAIYTVFLCMIMIAVSSCKKSFDELGADANRPNSAPPALLFNGILNDLYDAPFSGNTKSSNFENWCQYFLWNYDYYGNNRYDFGPGTNYYNTLKNVVKMEEEANKLQLPKLNPYTALSKFMKAYFFTNMSLQMGDLPMKNALQGLSNLTPVYDSQKEIFKQAFAWLDSANIELTALQKTVNILQGDIYLNNDIAQWQKVVNTFRIRLLIHLSKRADDTSDLLIKQQFNDIISNPAKYPLMGSEQDNLEYKYVYPTNKYPKNPGNFGFDALRENTSATYISLLTSLNDPRVYVTCEPASTLFKESDPGNMSAFVGANAGEDLGIMYVKANNGEYSLINRYRYYRTYIAENTIQIGYSELCFNIAEGINMGWAPAMTAIDAENYYKKGISTSMAFYGIPATGTMPVYFFKQSASIDDPTAYNKYNIDMDFTAYYNQSSVLYGGNNAKGLLQIQQQRYLSLFSHSGLESYFQYRRTGVPTFGTGSGTGNSNRIAMRFQYPASEITTNTDNYKTALNNQFGGNDDINGIMWILK